MKKNQVPHLKKVGKPTFFETNKSGMNIFYRIKSIKIEGLKFKTKNPRTNGTGIF
jgi:hypothetical protein